MYTIPRGFSLGQGESRTERQEMLRVVNYQYLYFKSNIHVQTLAILFSL